ncbi:frizzled-5-like [Limulus polyphemus]|uniref:Frizzled-5-like n=1 Tax=Limulus polyphemus TaxID=6850 RepID=A0ABM1TQ96_LIMPO|nr:frizzled-5-like [Limulus polyphemus]
MNLLSILCGDSSKLISIWILFASVTTSGVHVEESGTSSEECEEITISMCKDVGYNYTSMPNQFYHDTQEEAGLEAHQFWPLVEIQCSGDLLFFLCSVYTPICMPDYSGSIPACRSVCERARTGCAPIMQQYGFTWPERLDCHNFPKYNDPSNLCMGEQEGKSPKRPIFAIKDENSIGMTQEPLKDDTTVQLNRNPKFNIDFEVPETTYNPQLNHKCGCMCRYPMVSVTDNENKKYYNKVETGGVVNCAIACRGNFYSIDEHKFANLWLGLWAVLCCLSTSITVTTFLIDVKRFRYPERPIIFLSGCYLMVSIGYLIRIGVGHDAVACDGPIIVYPSSERSATCTIVFLLVYFFGMASSLWWVMLALTWLLAAGLKWGNEAITRYSSYFHVVAWTMPAVKTISVLALDGIDGDPVSGICYVGNQDLSFLRGFVIAPLCVYLFLGTCFLLAGFVELFRIRNVIRQQSEDKVDKLEKLMIRIGVFSVLYTVPATVVIGCYVYEQHFREAWEQKHNCPCNAPDIKPDYSIFMLKYFMCLVVGITSGFWIWSGKTLDSWRKFLRKFCRIKSQERHNGYTFRQDNLPNQVEQVLSSKNKQAPVANV